MKVLRVGMLIAAVVLFIVAALGIGNGRLQNAGLALLAGFVLVGEIG